MDQFILYGSKDDKNTVKELITAKYAGVNLKLQQADVNSPDYLNKNPFGKPPLLETSEGSIFESNAIARFLARVGNQDLLGLTLKEQGHIEMWIELASSEIDGPLTSWYEGRKGSLPYDSKPYFKEVLGEIQLCEKPLEAPKGAQKAKGQGAAAVQQQPKKEKQQQQPKQPKPAQQQAPTPTAAEQEAQQPKEAKPKNPLDLLPPSKMILDSWKRLYSNAPASRFREVAINGLWNGGDITNSPNQEHFEGFDPEGFSIWTLDYKYPEENTVNFIVMNKENCPDLELYDWAKVDLNDKKAIARIEDMLCEEEKIDGLEHVECKVFK